MTTVDIREFLKARLAEDELWALAASADRDGKTTVPGGVHWTWATGDHWEPVEPDPLEPYMGGYGGEWSNEVVLRTVEEWPLSYGGTLPHKIAEAEELRTADGAHIARHDPARVLRDVEAKRRLLAIADTHARFDERDPNPFYAGFGPAMLAALALPYAEHGDFDPSWSPTS